MLAKFELNKLEKKVEIFEAVKGSVQLRDIMQRDVVTAGKEISIVEASKLMEEHDISCVVIEKDEVPLGIVTERDMVRKVIIQGMDRNTSVEKIMTSPLVTLGMTEEVIRGVKLMVENGMRRLPVVENGKLVGIVTATDVLGLF